MQDTEISAAFFVTAPPTLETTEIFTSSVISVSVINLLSARKLRLKTQSETRLESDVLIVHLMAEVVCLRVRLKTRKCCIVYTVSAHAVIYSRFVVEPQKSDGEQNEVSLRGTVSRSIVKERRDHSGSYAFNMFFR